MTHRYSMEPVDLWIGGERVKPSTGQYFDDRNPEDDSVYASVALAGPEDVNRAVAAAQAAFGSYSKTTASQREAWLAKAAQLLDERKERFVEVLIDECGVPLRVANFMHGLSLEMMHAASGMPRWIRGHTLASDVPGRFSFSTRSPLGVVAAIIPFNVPLIKGVRLSANALAVGNTVVMLPSEEAPLIAHMLADVYADAGLPPGAFNVVSGMGYDIGDTLTGHRDVKMVTFTGSSRVGRHIQQICARDNKRVTLELGGKSPLIVLADADIERAVAAATHGTFTFQGQACMASTRIYVDRKVIDEFTDRFVAAARGLQLGDLRAPTTAIGPLISKRQRDRVTAHVEDARAKGAAVLTGGNWRGNRFEPTILSGVQEGMTVCREETFGPVTSIYPITSAEEGLQLANDSVYGLSAALFTRDVTTAMKYAESIQSGMLHINASSLHDEPHVPFGGVGESGFGREGSDADIEAMTEWKWVTVQQ
ncbi:MAG: aldehyde dehydrogenase family protein [Polaromonas sp.]